MSMKIHKAILSAIVAWWAIGTARADVIYTYTGHHFTSVHTPYTTSNFVSMILTFAVALPGGLNNAAVYPTAMTLSDGQQTLTLSTPGIISLAELTTSGVGAITGWTVQDRPVNGSFSVLIESSSSADDTGYINNRRGGYGTNASWPGVWVESTTSPIPEPSSFALSALALTALMWIRTRRSFRNPKAQGTRLGKAA